MTGRQDQVGVWFPDRLGPWAVEQEALNGGATHPSQGRQLFAGFDALGDDVDA